MTTKTLGNHDDRWPGRPEGLRRDLLRGRGDRDSAVPLMVPLQAYHLNILMQASTYAIAVFGLTVVPGYTGPDQSRAGGVLRPRRVQRGARHHDVCASFWLALVLGAGVAAVAAVHRGSRLLRLGGHYLAMVNSFQDDPALVLANWVSFTRGLDGVTGIGRPSLFGHAIADSSHYLVLCIVALYVVGFPLCGGSGTPGSAARCRRCATTSSRRA